jgi:hypothetical protein
LEAPNRASTHSRLDMRLLDKLGYFGGCCFLAVPLIRGGGREDGWREHELGTGDGGDGGHGVRAYESEH